MDAVRQATIDFEEAVADLRLEIRALELVEAAAIKLHATSGARSTYPQRHAAIDELEGALMALGQVRAQRGRNRVG